MAERAIPIDYRPAPEPDPVLEAKHYVLYEWFQAMMPVRSKCFRCHVLSPIVFVPWPPEGGALAFGDPRKLRKPNGDKKRDITKDTVDAFAKAGWKFQLRSAYCPNCKGLGSVP